MAKIIQTDSQSKALIKIKANLKSIENINRFLELSTDSGFISFSFGGNVMKLPIEKKAADTFAEGLKKDLITETKRLSSANSIQLSSDDETVLNKQPRKSDSYL